MQLDVLATRSAIAAWRQAAPRMHQAASFGSTRDLLLSLLFDSAR